MSEDMLNFKSGSQLEFSADDGEKKQNAAPLTAADTLAAALPPKKRRRADRDEDIRETGRCLAAARQKCGLSAEQVAADTRIKLDHIEALEAGRMADLPQLIYVLAYVSKLGKLYGIPETELDELRAPLRDITYEIPENLPRMLDVEPSEENKVVLRRMVIVFFSAIGLLVLALLVCGIMLIFGRRGDKVPEVLPDTALEEQILQLQEPPKLAIPPAPVGK